MKYLSIAFLWLLAALSCWGQTVVDQKNHCDAITEQARGIADQLRGPNLVGGLTQPSSGTPSQSYVGIQNSIANDRKAGDTMTAAWRNCTLYNLTEDATLRISYALPGLQRDALHHRVEIIDAMKARLGEITLDAQKRIDAQNLTRVTLYSIQSAQAKMNLDRSATQQAAGLIYVPEDLSTTPLKYLLTNKQLAEISEQEAVAKLQHANNWDVELESGVHHQLFSSTPTGPSSLPGTARTGLYGAVTFSWGLNSKAVDTHLNAGVKAYGQWKETQEGDVTRDSVVLWRELLNSIGALQDSNTALLAQQQVINTNLDSVKNSDTAAGLAFSYQLKTDRLLLQIEIEDTEYRLSILQAYLNKNF